MLFVSHQQQNLFNKIRTKEKYHSCTASLCGERIQSEALLLKCVCALCVSGNVWECTAFCKWVKCQCKHTYQETGAQFTKAKQQQHEWHSENKVILSHIKCRCSVICGVKEVFKSSIQQSNEYSEVWNENFNYSPERIKLVNVISLSLSPFLSIFIFRLSLSLCLPSIVWVCSLVLFTFEHEHSKWKTSLWEQWHEKKPGK